MIDGAGEPAGADVGAPAAPWWPSCLRRDAGVVATALLTYAAVQGGLFYVAPHAQAAVLVGLVAGLASPSRSRSAVCGFIAFAMGAMLLPGAPWSPSGPAVALLGGLGAALVAALSRAVLSARPGWRRTALGLAVMLVIVNMWSTTLVVDGASQSAPGGVLVPPLPAVLNGALPAHLQSTDDALFHAVRQRVLGGTPYYLAYARTFEEQNPFGIPWVFGFRMPTLFRLFALVPSPTASVVVLLLLATAAIASVLFLHRDSQRLPFVVPACGALAAYALAFTTSTAILYPEPWAAFFGLISLGAFAVSSAARGRAASVAMLVSAACALFGALLREPMAIMLAAGLAAAAGAAAGRRTRLAVWGGASLLFALAYATHLLAVRPFVSYSWKHATFGGLSHVVAAFEYGTMLLGYGTWLPLLLAVLGIAGAFALTDVRVRIFATATVCLFLAVFFLVSNDGRTAGGGTWNYWGAMLDPLLYALVPAALSSVAGPADGGVAGARTARAVAIAPPLRSDTPTGEARGG